MTAKLGTKQTTKNPSGVKGGVYNVRPASTPSTKVRLPNKSGKQGRG